MAFPIDFSIHVIEFWTETFHTNLQNKISLKQEYNKIIFWI